MEQLQSFKRPGSYGKADAAQKLVTEWADSRGLVSLEGYVVFGPKGGKATFAFVEGGPRLRERIALATKMSRLPFHIVTADDFDGTWAWRRLTTGETGTGTRQDFQRYVCRLTQCPDHLKGLVAPDVRADLMADKNKWPDLAIREIGNTLTTNKTDIDSVIVDKDIQRSLLMIEGQHVSKDRPWRITRSCGLETGSKSCCIQYNDDGQFSMETKPYAGFGPWLSAGEMKTQLNQFV